MKKVLSFLVIVLVMSMFIVSLSSAYYSNYAAPQLEYITNSFSILWNKPKAEILRIMSLFPDYVCTDYTDQLVCTSKFNTNDQNNIVINFFVDDYEEHHDNLWKVSVTIDVQSADEVQQLFTICWIDGMKPFHDFEDKFSYKGVQPLYFDNEVTKMVTWFQPFNIKNNPFFLVEYYNGYMQ